MQSFMRQTYNCAKNLLKTCCRFLAEKFVEKFYINRVRRILFFSIKVTIR